MKTTAASLASYHMDHVCTNCSAKYGAHAGRGNPHVAESACPSGVFPKWPTSIDDEKRAGEVFDERVAAFWQASKTTFKPRR